MKFPDSAARLAARQPNGRRPQVMHHRWEHLLFLHWRVAPERVQQTLPQGLTVDTFDGEAYVGVTPFFMRDVRPVGVPAIPWLSEFQELNVRTYVFDGEGTPGIWFYSLTCNQPLAVIAARALTGLPYYNATMRSEIGEFIDYSCRRDDTPLAAEYRYRATGKERSAAVSSLEFFLLERYYLFSLCAGSLLREQVSHAPYQFRDAETPIASALPARLDGFSGLADTPDHSCYVAGFDVKVFATEKVN